MQSRRPAIICRGVLGPSRRTFPPGPTLLHSIPRLTAAHFLPATGLAVPLLFKQAIDHLTSNSIPEIAMKVCRTQLLTVRCQLGRQHSDERVRAWGASRAGSTLRAGGSRAGNLAGRDGGAAVERAVPRRGSSLQGAAACHLLACLPGGWVAYAATGRNRFWLGAGFIAGTFHGSCAQTVAANRRPTLPDVRRRPLGAAWRSTPSTTCSTWTCSSTSIGALASCHASWSGVGAPPPSLSARHLHHAPIQGCLLHTMNPVLISSPTGAGAPPRTRDTSLKFGLHVTAKHIRYAVVLL